MSGTINAPSIYSQTCYIRQTTTSEQGWTHTLMHYTQTISYFIMFFKEINWLKHRRLPQDPKCPLTLYLWYMYVDHTDEWQFSTSSVWRCLWEMIELQFFLASHRISIDNVPRDIETLALHHLLQIQWLGWVDSSSDIWWPRVDEVKRRIQTATMS